MPSCRSPSGSRGRTIKSYNSRGRPSALETNGHVKLDPIDSSSQSESTSQVSVYPINIYRIYRPQHSNALFQPLTIAKTIQKKYRKSTCWIFLSIDPLANWAIGLNRPALDS